jgi:hypothetical protein
MSHDAVLGPDELVPGRPFTDPGNTLREVGVMQAMLEHEHQLAAARSVASGGPWIDRTHDREDHRHLLVVPDTTALLEAADLTAVGFFGRPREEVDHAVLFDLEEELIERMGFYGEVGLLSYYDLELVKGSYGNLILFSTPDVPAEWYQDGVHRRAVEITPRHYHEIRLHKGTVAGPLAEGDIVVERTKYFDFANGVPWQAVRHFPGRPSGESPDRAGRSHPV